MQLVVGGSEGLPVGSSEIVGAGEDENEVIRGTIHDVAPCSSVVLGTKPSEQPHLYRGYSSLLGSVLTQKPPSSSEGQG